MKNHAGSRQESSHRGVGIARPAGNAIETTADRSIRWARNRSRQRASTHVSHSSESAGPLAGIMFVYIVVVVGRLTDVVPLLSSLPLAKIVAALAIVVAIQSRSALASVPVLSLAPAKLTLMMMLLITVSFLFSVWHSSTLGVITGTALSVSVGLILLVKAAVNWRATRRLLFGFAFSAVVLAAAANVTSYAGRAGEIRSLDPNDFAFVLDGLLPIALTFAITSRGLKKLCYLGASLWVVLSILLTQSRGGLLGLVAAIVVMIFIAPTRRGRTLTRSPSAATITIRVALLMLVGGLVWHSLPSTVRSRLATIATVDSDRSMKEVSDGRITIWEDTLPLSLSRPWGWGAGTFAAVDGVYAGGRYKAPHNTLLQALIELGFPGLWLFVTTLTSAFRYLARESWGSEITEDQDSLEKRAFARGMIASFVGLCVSGFFLSELYTQALWTMVVLACLVGRPAMDSGSLDNDVLHRNSPKANPA